MKQSVHIFVIYILLCSVCSSDSANFWEFLIGPRLGNQTRDQSGGEKTTEQIVKSYGYRLDTHLVESETGHILTLHRIPKGHNVHSGSRPVAFIHHGLFGCSDMWLLRGPQHDLPYMLADAGYDVWLFNTRGNTYSRKHKFLDPDRDSEYWNFGIEEIGYYDLPASIDYILNATNQKNLYFLGHSIGSSSGFIACILRPAYNKKIRLFLALGPLTNVKHSLSPFHKVFFALSSFSLRFSESMNIYEIMPRRPTISKLFRMLCEDNSPLQKLCLMTIFSVVGDDFGQFNTTTFPHFVQYYPSGTSLRVLADVVQYYLSGDFARSEFNSMLPLDRKTPVYNLSKISVPVSIHYGPGDYLVTEEDVDDLGKRLPNCVGKYRIPYKQFNHLDFVLAVNARSLLYDSLLHVMEKYR